MIDNVLSKGILRYLYTHRRNLARQAFWIRRYFRLFFDLPL